MIARAPQFAEDAARLRRRPRRRRAPRACATRATRAGAAHGVTRRRSRGSARRSSAGAREPAPRARRPRRAAARARRPRSTRRSSLGLRDYVDKNGFERVVLGLSGGIDSALVALRRGRRARRRARDAARSMPSPYSSRGHAGRRARARRATSASSASSSPIAPAMSAYDDDARARRSPAASPDIAEENLQARIRGNLLMALSNKFGWLVLTTGNKSEISVGYSTLYGDIAGGFAVLKDVPKTLVYRLVALPQRGGRRRASIPAVDHRPRRRAPSCAPTSATRTRCRPTTCSTAILEAYVEEDLGREQLIAARPRPRRTSTA